MKRAIALLAVLLAGCTNAGHHAASVPNPAPTTGAPHRATGTGLVVRAVLPSAAMVPGSSMTGRVIVENMPAGKYDARSLSSPLVPAPEPIPVQVTPFAP